MVGSIPTEIGTMTKLTHIEINIKRDNEDDDDDDSPLTLPSEIGRLFNLEVLFLRASHLQGTIPTELGLLGSNLWSLDLGKFCVADGFSSSFFGKG